MPWAPKSVYLCCHHPYGPKLGGPVALHFLTFGLVYNQEPHPSCPKG